MQNMPNMDGLDELMSLSSTQLNTHTHTHTHVLSTKFYLWRATIRLEKQVFHPQFEILDELHLLLNKKISCKKRKYTISTIDYKYKTKHKTSHNLGHGQNPQECVYIF